MRTSRLITFILGIFMILTGVYCLFNPAMTYMSLAYVIGVNMIIDSVGGIILWHERKKAGLADGWGLAEAIVSLVCGIALNVSMALQLIVDMMIVYMAAAWLIVIGIIRIILAVKLRGINRALGAQIPGRHWWLVLIAGILLILCGILSLFNPAGLIVAIGIHFGLNIIIAGATMIAVAA